jgi:hypothetical protein
VSIRDRLTSAWNAFQTKDDEAEQRIHSYGDYGASYGSRSESTTRLNVINERTILSSILTRLSIDVAGVAIRHARTDEEDRFQEVIPSGLNNCLSIEANVDQAARALRQDIAMTMFDKGVACIVPVDTTLDPEASGSFDIKTLRVGEVKQWYPYHVRVSLYNERTGVREEITLPKRIVAIAENPLYSVMNEPNSTLQRLTRKLSLLDTSDELSASGKLDLIIQLPYVIKSEARREAAEQRRKDIEFQLKGSKYGIAYTDGTEKITQLNRPAENNLLKQVEFLTALLYTQLGLTPEVMDGTADEKAMLNYNNRTVMPVLDAITEAMTRSFLTKTARSQKQRVLYFRDPFKLVPVTDIAEIADKFTRNEIMSANEIRGAIGLRPSKDPKADELRNSNMPAPSAATNSEDTNQEGDSQNGS